MIEEVLRDFYRSNSEWAIISLRYFNPVGNHPSGEIGEDPSGPPNNLMPYVAQVTVVRILSMLYVLIDDYSLGGCGEKASFERIWGRL